HDFEEEFDLHINNGRMLEHFHEGNLTNKSDGIQEKVPEIFVEVSPQLAKERKFSSGAIVRLTSPFRTVRLSALVTDHMQKNELLLPKNSVSKETDINFITRPIYEGQTNTPAYRKTKVNMEVLSKDGASPLTETNHRNKKRNLQKGVEVE